MNLEKNKHLGNIAKSFEKFLSEAKEIHGDNFDYSDFVYVNNKTKGVIHCKKCGYTFSMIPSNHICKKQGCPRCQNRLKYTTEEWIEKAREVHGDDYDYSETEYINSDTKLKIICRKKDEFGNEHGAFYQNPRKHINGQGCPKCSHQNPVDFKTFEKRTKKIHGDKFIYYQDEYKGYNVETKITCPKHGDFYQKPSLHAIGHSCPQCSAEHRAEHNKISFEEFKKRARKVHGDEYDYDENSYVNYTTKVRIFCKKHGWFEQLPQKHVDRQQKCPKCRLEEQSERQKLTREEAIERSVQVHGNRYDYSKSDYQGNMIPMEIICPIHGSFWQKPIKHWIGQGCPKCNQSHLEREVEQLLKEMNINYVYQATKKDLEFLQMKSLDFYIPSLKIGIECQGIQHFEDNGFLKCEKVISRDKEKYDISKENNISIIYYTNLEEKIQNNDFYSDKKVFMNINNLRKFLNDYETAN